MLTPPQGNSPRRSRWDQAPYPHEMETRVKTQELIEFQPSYVLRTLKSLPITSQTGHRERMEVLVHYMPHQLVAVYNHIISECEHKNQFSDSAILQAIGQTLSKKGNLTQKIRSIQVGVPRANTYQIGTSGDTVPTIPGTTLHFIRLT